MRTTAGSPDDLKMRTDLDAPIEATRKPARLGGELCPCIPAWLCCLLLVSGPILAGQAQIEKPETLAARRYVVVVETSKAMQRRVPGVLETVQGYVSSGLNGMLREGDKVNLWTFSQGVYTNWLPFKAWSLNTQSALAGEYSRLLKAQNYEGRPDFEGLMAMLKQAMGEPGTVTMILISTGEEGLSGTPFDEQITQACRRWRDQQQKARMPIVTMLRATGGAFTDWSVTPAPWPLEFPPFPTDVELAAKKIAGSVPKETEEKGGDQVADEVVLGSDAPALNRGNQESGLVVPAKAVSQTRVPLFSSVPGIAETNAPAARSDKVGDKKTVAGPADLGPPSPARSPDSGRPGAIDRGLPLKTKATMQSGAPLFSSVPGLNEKIAPVAAEKATKQPLAKSPSTPTASLTQPGPASPPKTRERVAENVRQNKPLSLTNAAKFAAATKTSRALPAPGRPARPPAAPSASTTPPVLPASSEATDKVGDKVENDKHLLPTNAARLASAAEREASVVSLPVEHPKIESAAVLSATSPNPNETSRQAGPAKVAAEHPPRTPGPDPVSAPPPLVSPAVAELVLLTNPNAYAVRKTSSLVPPPTAEPASSTSQEGAHPLPSAAPAAAPPPTVGGRQSDGQSWTAAAPGPAVGSLTSAAPPSAPSADSIRRPRVEAGAIPIHHSLLNPNVFWVAILLASLASAGFFLLSWIRSFTRPIGEGPKNPLDEIQNERE